MQYVGTMHIFQRAEELKQEKLKVAVSKSLKV